MPMKAAAIVLASLAAWCAMTATGKPLPALGRQWYPGLMYQRGTQQYARHLVICGPATTFGYKDFMALFQAQRLYPTSWAAPFKAAGARYAVLVAERHDGFAMYDSTRSDWTAEHIDDYQPDPIHLLALRRHHCVVDRRSLLATPSRSHAWCLCAYPCSSLACAQTASVARLGEIVNRL